jgi:hypothetical protein
MPIDILAQKSIITLKKYRKAYITAIIQTESQFRKDATWLGA